MFPPEHTTQITRNQLNQRTENGQYSRPALDSEGLRHSKMQAYPLTHQNINMHLRLKNNIIFLGLTTRLVAMFNTVPHQKRPI